MSEDTYAQKGKEARWQIVDIPIPQEQLTTLKKDQRTPKGTHARSKALSKSTNREATNHGKNGKNDLQLNTPNSPAPEVSTLLQAPL
jgi:hypothetical protein